MLRMMWFYISAWIATSLTVVGNGFVVYLIISRPQLHSTSNVFVASLAVADFAVGVTYFPPIFVLRSIPFSGSSRLDQAVFVTRHYFQYCSALNLCAMAIDRSVSILKPLNYITFMTSKRVALMLTAAWVVPLAFFVVPQSIFIRNDEHKRFFALYRTLMFNTVPSLVLLFLAMRLFAVVRLIARDTKSLMTQLRFNYPLQKGRLTTLATNADKRAASGKMMVSIVVIFILCHAGENWKSVCREWPTVCSVPEDMKDLLDVLCIMNSAANPIAYAFLKKDIRIHIKRVLHIKR